MSDLPVCWRQWRIQEGVQKEWRMTYLAGLLVVILQMSTGSEIKEFCQFDTFEGKCRSNEVIIIEHAQFGRMRAGKCISGEGYIGCKTEVVKQMDAMCSGRHSCEVKVADIRSVAQPCKRDYTAYLEASYKCVQVEGAGPGGCSKSERVVLARDSGYLSSLTVAETGLGTTDCPWAIQATPGQHILLSVMEFGLMTKKGDEEWTRLNYFTSNCPVILSVKDGDDVKQYPLCAEGRRERELFTSDSHVIDMHLNIRMNQGQIPHFILRYQVSGCSDIAAPPNGAVVRSGNKATIRCNDTHETWYITCDGTRWIGEMGSCSPGKNWGIQRLFGTEIPVGQGILIAVAIGIALGIVFGTTLLAAVLFCKKEKWRRHRGPAVPVAEEERDSSTYPSLLKHGGGGPVRMDSDSGFYTGPKSLTTRSADPYDGPPRRSHVYECPNPPPVRRAADLPLPDPPLYFDFDPALDPRDQSIICKAT